jgi:hypothetical protein
MSATKPAISMTATHIDTTVLDVTRFHYESDDREILAFLHDVADAAADELDALTDWSFSGVREGQYSADIAIDDLVLDMLDEAGFGVLSEESGLTNFSWPVTGDELMVVVDPVDGSTNAGKGVPWFATSQERYVMACRCALTELSDFTKQLSACRVCPLTIRDGGSFVH